MIIYKKKGKKQKKVVRGLYATRTELFGLVIHNE
jgi:hypothetical protein